MSNNRGQADPLNVRFLVVEYENKKVLIGRKTSYEETLVYIKRAFGAIRNTADEDLIISAHFEELGDSFRILDDIWSEVLPQLTSVQVTLDHSTKPSKQDTTKPSKQETIHITINLREPGSGLTSDRGLIKTFSMDVLPNLTDSELRAQVVKHDQAIRGIQALYHNGADLSDTRTLTQQGIGQNSVLVAVPS